MQILDSDWRSWDRGWRGSCHDRGPSGCTDSPAGTGRIRDGIRRPSHAYYDATQWQPECQCCSRPKHPVPRGSAVNLGSSRSPLWQEVPTTGIGLQGPRYMRRSSRSTFDSSSGVGVIICVVRTSPVLQTTSQRHRGLLCAACLIKPSRLRRCIRDALHLFAACPRWPTLIRRLEVPFASR